jgi:hypothetical protein
MKSGNTINDVLFSIAFNPFAKESLFQKSNNSSKIGEAIHPISIKEVLLYFAFFRKIRLNTANKIISNEHGFLKIMAIAIKHKKI